MKKILIIISTLILIWLLPKLLHMFTDTASDRIFVYYSSVEKDFCYVGFDNKQDKQIRKNITTGKEYTRSEFDSILPLFYYRQLLSEGRMPDSIHGVPINITDLNKKSFFFRYRPIDKNKPHIPLYIMFESMSGRVNLENPDDMFRINKKIEFLIPETNKVDENKSKLFNDALIKNKFEFPPRIVAGNSYSRKNYDEGYFVVDNSNQLFHIKMQKGKPYVHKVLFDNNIHIKHIMPEEPDDHSFYAFLFDDKGYVYVLTTNNYKIEKLPLEPINIDNSNISIMANSMYWNIKITNKNEEIVYAINANTKHLVKKHVFEKNIHNKKWLSYIFPYELLFKQKNTKYIRPRLKINYYYSSIINLVFMILFVVLLPKRKYNYTFFTPIWIVITGIFGLLAELIFLEKRNN